MDSDGKRSRAKSGSAFKGAEIVPLPVRNADTSAAILQLVKKRVDERLDFLMSGLTINVADALFEEMNGLTERDALAHHFNILRAIKLGDLKYKETFNGLNNHTWQQFPTKMEDGHILTPMGDVAVVISTYSEKTRNHYKVLLNETGARFATLFSRPVDRHPLYPDLYYRSFWQALSGLDMTYDERTYVVPLFHRFVMDRFGQILGIANRTLIEFKVDVL